jgi:hypothetical protein
MIFIGEVNSRVSWRQLNAKLETFRFWFSDDFLETLRLFGDGIKFVCGRSLHPMGNFNARLFRNGAWNNQVSGMMGAM